MDKTELIELFSQSRIESYTSVDEHEQNLKLISRIASKVGIIEIIIRNRIDRKMHKNNKNWLSTLPKHIILDDDEGKIKDHDTLVSRQTFGFWVKTAEFYKIHSCAFEDQFLRDFSFKNYYEKNKTRLNKTPLTNYQKAYGILLLAKSIRNRAFHFENLLKMRDLGIPRLSVRVDFSKEKYFYFNIKPNKIIQFLDDILSSFNERLTNYAKM